MSQTVHIRLDLSVAPRTLVCGLAALMLVTVAPELGSESVTLTTYYPAPSGVYTRMITTNNTWLARDGGGVSIGSSSNPPAGGLIVNGSVGIGTTGPSSALHVAGSWVPAQVTVSNPGDYLSGIGFLRAGSSQEWMLYRYGSGNSDRFCMGINGINEPFCIATNGNVSITGQITGKTRFGGGYVYIDGSASGCVGSGVSGGSAVCSAGQYVTWSPGFYTEGWSYQNRGGPIYATNKLGVRTTQVRTLTPGAPGSEDWGTLTKEDNRAYIYCCPK